MKWAISGALVVVFVAWVGFAGIAQAQIAGPAIENQGPVTTVSVDALTFSISGPIGTQEFHVTPMTAIYAGSERIEFNRMPEFVGTLAIVWSAPVESEQIAGRVTLLVYPVAGVVPGTGIEAGDHGVTTPSGGGETPSGNGGGNGGGNGDGNGGGNGGGNGQSHGEHGNSGKADNNEHGQGGERNHGH